MKVFRRMSILGWVIGIVAVAGCGDDGPSQPANRAPTVTVQAPNGGEVVPPGDTLDVRWTATDDGTVTGVQLSYRADGMSADAAIASNQPASGTYAWVVPAQALFGVKVKATATDDRGATGEDTSDGTFAVVTASARGYVKAEVCSQCHQARYDELQDSGHPHKLKKVAGGAPPTYPSTSVPNPPSGFSWSQITYVIGGYAWKARFMDSEGYILTNGYNQVASQYDMPRTQADFGTSLPGRWVAYEASATARKPYDCGRCHTTGWLTTAENGGVNQDGLPGILGTWEDLGVRCEACHGPGARHVATKNRADIAIDRRSEACGSCHYRDANHRILASGGFIRHHEQYDEMISARHTNLTCISCHDPHKGVRHGNAAAGGIKGSCESCHATQAANNRHLRGFAGAPTCVDCHMPRATRTARSLHAHAADIRTHIFKINPNAVPKDDPTNGMFYTENNTTYSRGHVTLDFACYGCHKDSNGVGGSYSQKSLAELSARAMGIHAATVVSQARR